MAYDIEMISCASCGIAFGIPSEKYSYLKEAGEGFFCPNGHALAFTESEVSKLKRIITGLKGDLDSYKNRETHLSELAEFYKRSAASYKGKLRRLTGGE